MKILLTAILALGFLSLILCSCLTNDDDDDKQQCNELDYTKYVQCIRKKLKRYKRSNDCEDNCHETNNGDCYNSCNDCNCDYCSERTCESFCSQCCQSTTCTTSNCCHRTCHAQCRTARCRHECKKECVDNIEVGEQQQQQQLDGSSGNITTIITLHTAINNTNIIDVPISINNTNVNNFTLDNSLLYPDYYPQPLPDKVVDISTGTSQSSNNNCCNVVSHGNCNPASQGQSISCNYPITQQCGPYCNSPIIHRQPCNYPQCSDQIMYIPQPQPRCIYHPIWPYVSCGMTQQPFCGGCYNHYNSYPFQPPPMHCSPACYDEGYGSVAPYYRHGPFYRRGFMHTPPSPACFQTGNCFQAGGATAGFGYQQQLANWNFGYPQLLNYPFYFNGVINDSDGLTPGIKVESVDSLTPAKEAVVANSTKSLEQPKIWIETKVNSTKTLRSRKKLNQQASLATETS